MGAKICFIAPSAESTALYKRTLATLPDPPPVFEGIREGAEAAARDALKQGYDILVTPEHNAHHLWGKVDTPIVAFPLTALDIARAVHRARQEYGDPVAFFESQYPYLLSASLREVLNYDFREFIYDGRADGVKKLEQAMREGCRAIVGGAVISGMARDRGIPCVLLLPTPEDILKVYQQALQIAAVRQIEQRQEMKFKYVVQYSFSGIIVADEENRVAVFNTAAEQILGTPADQVLGRAVDQVIPAHLLLGVEGREQPQLEAIRVVQGRQVMVNRIPIVEEGGIGGTIFTLQEVSNIQLLEEKIRRAGQIKGMSARFRFPDIVGRSRLIRDTIARAQRFAQTDETILITGESGTGKEVFAQSIHNASSRRAHPFLAVNCSAIAPSLLESELFGYAEGAFTGARRGGKQGMFELAHQGTIFLDEIGELSREAQGHLLRVLQEKEVMRLGDAKITPVDVRVIAATNRPLENALQQGLFRWDLYHRLNVLQLSLPPLREHPEDILPLADSFINQSCSNRRLAARMRESLAKYEGILSRYAWPGNVRELQNLLRRVVALVGTMTGESVEQEIRELLEESFGRRRSAPPPASEGEPGLPKATVAAMTDELVRQHYAQWRGSKSELARRLGIGRTTLWRRLRQQERR